MPNYFALTRLERLYLQMETTYGIVPNTAGTATLVGGNACRHTKFSLDNVVNLINRPDKTGTRSAQVGVPGRCSAKWKAEMAVACNIAGAAPNMDCFVQALMGQAGSVTNPLTATVDGGYHYGISDNVLSMSIYSFRQPASEDQRVAQGAVVTSGTFMIGNDVYTAEFEGEAQWGNSSNQFSVQDTTQKGGLTAFPTEPTNPATIGNIIAGFTGTFTSGGVTVANLRTVTIKHVTNNTVVRDTFGSLYGTAPEGDERMVTVAFSLYEDDSTGFANLIAAANLKTPLTLIAKGGITSASICLHTLKGVQLEHPTRSEARRYIADFPESRAHGSSLTARDEHTISFF